MGSQIDKYFSAPTHQQEKQEIVNKYGGDNIIISFIDGDDITHPQKFEILDYLYAHKQINGTILHRLYRRDCHGIPNKMETALDAYIDSQAHEQYINELLLSNSQVFYLKLDSDRLMQLLSPSLSRAVLSAKFSFDGLNATNMGEFHRAQHKWGARFSFKHQCVYAN